MATGESGMERPVASKVQAGAYGTGAMAAFMTILSWFLVEASFGPHWDVPVYIFVALAGLLGSGASFLSAWMKQENVFFPAPPPGVPLVPQAPVKE